MVKKKYHKKRNDTAYIALYRRKQGEFAIACASNKGGKAPPPPKGKQPLSRTTVLRKEIGKRFTDRRFGPSSLETILILRGSI